MGEPNSFHLSRKSMEGRIAFGGFGMADDEPNRVRRRRAKADGRIAFGGGGNFIRRFRLICCHFRRNQFMIEPFPNNCQLCSQHNICRVAAALRNPPLPHDGGLREAFTHVTGLRFHFLPPFS
jgi:hypothetical protein